MSAQTVNYRLLELLKQTIDILSSAEKNIIRSHLLQPDSIEEPKYSAIDIIQSAPGQQIFKTPEEVDRYLREERDSWDN